MPATISAAAWPPTKATNRSPDCASALIAVYLLTRQGNVTTNYLAAVQKRLQDARRYRRNRLEERSLAAALAGRRDRYSKLLKQDKEADRLIAAAAATSSNARDDTAAIDYELLLRSADPRCDRAVSARRSISPIGAKALSPRVVENICRARSRRTSSTRCRAAMTMLALDVYASTNAVGRRASSALTKSMQDGSSKPIAALQGKLVQAGVWSGGDAAALRRTAADLPAGTSSTRPGYDRDAAVDGDQERPGDRARLHRHERQTAATASRSAQESTCM